MKIFLCYIALFASMLTLPLAAASQPGGGAVFTLGRTAGGLEVSLELGGFGLEEQTDGTCRLEAAGLSASAAAPGEPLLPSATALLAVPSGIPLRLESVSASGDTTLRLPKSRRLTSAPALPGVKGGAAATGGRSEAGLAGREAVRLVKLGTMWRTDVYRLEVCPFSLCGDIRVHRRIEASIAAADLVPLRAEPTMPAPLLVVGREWMREQLRPFLRWKRQQGHEVIELYMEMADADSVKAAVARAAAGLRGGDMPALLLVGDAKQIEPFFGRNQPQGFDLHVTDLYHAELDGDYLPDMTVGRWPVGDSAELAAVVAKTLAFERAESPDGAARRRVLLVAGAESSEPAPVTTNGEVAYLAGRFKQKCPETDTLCHYNPASADEGADVTGQLAEGVALVAYTAHCTSGGWSSPRLRADSLDASTPPAVWFNNCCSSNDFSGNCLGRRLLCMDGSGAVAVVGATNQTMWNEDYYWAVGPVYPFSDNPAYDSLRPGAFDALLALGGHCATMGSAMLGGGLAVAAAGSPYDRFYWETYCLLGDPTLRPQLGDAAELTLLLDDSVRVGDASLYVHAMPGTVVTAMQADSLLGRAVADSAGLVGLWLRQSVDTLPLLLTATAPGARPATLLVEPAAPLAPMGFYDVAVADSVVSLRLANLAADTLHDVRLSLRQPQSVPASATLLACDTASLPVLAPGERKAVELHYSIARVGSSPRWEAALVALAGGVENSLLLCHAFDYDYPAVTWSLTDGTGQRLRTLSAGAPVTATAAVAGRYDSLYLSAVAWPAGAAVQASFAEGEAARLDLVMPDSASHLRLDYRVSVGGHSTAVSSFVETGCRCDGFEHGLSLYPWQQGGSKGWVVDSLHGRSGSLCLRSSPIDYRQTSDLLLRVCLPQADTLRYWARTSSEKDGDVLAFAVDGYTRGLSLSGESGWRQYSQFIAAGCHTLRWRYRKDESIDRGDDCAWIDDVRLPLALWSAAYGLASPCDSSLGLDNPRTKPEVSVYPNPTTGRVTVESASALVSLSAIDLYGREVWRMSATGLPSASADLGSLGGGVYLLRIVSLDGVAYRKLIINRNL